jgi:hypothetical protein
MIDPALALQKAVRAHLISDTAITDLVPADHVRAGSTRPDKLPAIMISNATTMMHGHAAGSQYVATVFLDLHLWALEDGLDTVQAIGAAVAHRLISWPATAASDFELDAFKHQRTIYPRDPDPQYGHGVVFIEATVRWRL